MLHSTHRYIYVEVISVALRRNGQPKTRIKSAFTIGTPAVHIREAIYACSVEKASKEVDAAMRAELNYRTQLVAGDS